MEDLLDNAQVQDLLEEFVKESQPHEDKKEEDDKQNVETEPTKNDVKESEINTDSNQNKEVPQNEDKTKKKKGRKKKESIVNDEDKTKTKKEKKKKDKPKEDQPTEANDESTNDQPSISNPAPEETIDDKSKKPKKKKKKEETDKSQVSVNENKSKDKDKDKDKDKEKSDDEKEKKPKKKKKTNDDSSKNTKNISKDKSKSKVKKADKSDNNNEKIDDPKEYVLQYMISQNRPYSLINVFDNLHGSIKKGQLQRILDQLVDEKKLVCKEYQSKIYMASQSNFEPVSDELLNELEDQIVEKRKIISNLKEEIALKNATLKTINAELTDAELDQHIIDAKKKLDSLLPKVKKIESNTIEAVKEDDMMEEEKKNEVIRNKYKKIRKIVKNILGEICEGLECKESVFMEEHGIEDDKEILIKNSIKI